MGTSTIGGAWLRQVALPGFGVEGQERLARARVVVAGAGGLGSAVLPVLAAAGVGELVVVDPDVVEASNLHRQTLHTATDLGRAKVESAAEALRALTAGRDGTGAVIPVPAAVDAENAAALVADADLVVDGTDSLEARYALDDAAAAAGVPLVWGSAVGYAGQVGVAWAGHGPRWRDLFPVPPAGDAVDACDVAGVLPSVCTTIGGLMATEALKLLTGVGTPLTGRVLVLDALAGRIREIPYAAADPTPAPEPAPEHAAAEEADLLVTELADRVEDGEDVQLIDVRQPWEAAIAVLPGSRLIPLRELPDRLDELDPRREVVTYCHAGVRSADAAAFLRERGFRARSLAGGIDAWSRVVDPDVPRY
jgi:adenylyltransferase/sulfurtransferase